MFEIFQFLGGLLLTIGYLPMIIQIIKQKSSKGINITTFLMLGIGLALMEVYAISLAVKGIAIPFLITTSFSLILVTALCFLIHFYKEKKCQTDF
jgi:MtN3 and saliva related transmembrane protein